VAIGTIGEGLFELGLDQHDVYGPVRRGYGGDAANTAVMAARLGHEARLCSRVGSDALGRLLLSFWRESGVDTSWVIADESAPTGVYVNERASDGGRFHYHRLGSAGSRLAPDDVPEAFLDGLDFVHTTGVTLAISSSAADAARGTARRARERGVATSFAVNHRPALAGDVPQLLDEARASDVVFISDDEGVVLFETDEPREIAVALGGGPGEVVLTCGEDGAFVAVEGALTHVAAPPVEVVDTAGAGDALAAAYLCARIEGVDPHRALERGVAAASLSCLGHGCALSYPDASSVVALAAPR
jgi:2-dehydro-3-deoxygluconokinase